MTIRPLYQCLDEIAAMPPLDELPALVIDWVHHRADDVRHGTVLSSYELAESARGQVADALISRPEDFGFDQLYPRDHLQLFVFSYSMYMIAFYFRELGDGERHSYGYDDKEFCSMDDSAPGDGDEQGMRWCATDGRKPN